VYHRESQQQIQCGLNFSDRKNVEAINDEKLFARIGLEISKNGKYVAAFLQSKIKVLDVEANKIILACQPFGPRMIFTP